MQSNVVLLPSPPLPCLGDEIRSRVSESVGQVKGSLLRLFPVAPAYFRMPFR